MDVKSHFSSVCHTSGFRFALPVKLEGGVNFVKENQDRLGISFEPLGWGGGSGLHKGSGSTVACVGPDVLQRNISLDLTT